MDEYRDTSGTQNRLIQLLTGGEEKPNVFVVGDDDQSIYRFQGANIENMEQFAGEHFAQDLRTIVLTQNYRSVQNILDVSMSANRPQQRLPAGGQAGQPQQATACLQPRAYSAGHSARDPPLQHLPRRDGERITTEVEQILAAGR